jgi:zinc protease
MILKSKEIAALNIIICLCFIFVPQASAFEIKKVTSTTGINAWLVEDHKNPLITMQFVMRGGSSADPKNKSGLAYLVSGLLDEGAGDMDSKSFQAFLERNSISLSFSARMDTFSGTLTTLTETKEEAFKSLRLALTVPRFDEDPISRVKSQILASLRGSKENPNKIAGRLWWQLAFPNHAYGRSNKGSASSIKNITREDMRQFVQRTFTKDNITISVVGDITPEELSNVLDDVFSDLPESFLGTRLGDGVIENQGQTVIIEREIPQSVVIFGSNGIKREDPDWYAATILFEILSGGFGSRLTEEIREKRGLTYGVSAYPLSLEKAGIIVGSVSTVNNRVAESIRLIKDIWQKFGDDGPTLEEMRNAKDYINGSFALRFTNSKSIAGVLNAVQRFDLGTDYLKNRTDLINRVTLRELKRVAKRLFKAKELTFVIVGKPKNIISTMPVPMTE